MVCGGGVGAWAASLRRGYHLTTTPRAASVRVRLVVNKFVTLSLREPWRAWTRWRERYIARWMDSCLQPLSRRGAWRPLGVPWSLVSGRSWSLVIGHWSLVIGHWSLVVGHWSLVIGHWSLVIGRAACVTRSSSHAVALAVVYRPAVLCVAREDPRRLHLGRWGVELVSRYRRSRLVLALVRSFVCAP